MTTTVCINTDGLTVDPDGKLALNLGTAPTACDETDGEYVFADADGKLRVPDYSNGLVVSDTGAAATDGDFAATGAGLYRLLSEATLNHTNDTCRTQIVDIIGRTLGPRIRLTPGNSLELGHSLIHAIDATAGIPVAGNFQQVAFMDPNFMTTGFLDLGFPPGIYHRVVSLAPGELISVRYTASYDTGDFSAHADNAVAVDGTELILNIHS